MHSQSIECPHDLNKALWHVHVLGTMDGEQEKRAFFDLEPP